MTHQFITQYAGSCQGGSYLFRVKFSGSGLSRKPVRYSLSSCFFEFLRNLGAFPLVLADLRAVIGLFLFKMCSRHCRTDSFVYTHMVNICIKD